MLTALNLGDKQHLLIDRVKIIFIYEQIHVIDRYNSREEIQRSIDNAKAGNSTRIRDKK